MSRYADYPNKTYRDLVEALNELTDDQLDMQAFIRVGNQYLLPVKFCYIFDANFNDNQMHQEAFEKFADEIDNHPILEVDSSNYIILNAVQLESMGLEGEDVYNFDNVRE